MFLAYLVLSNSKTFIYVFSRICMFGYLILRILKSALNPFDAKVTSPKAQ